MTAENFDQLLESMLSRTPFRVFTIELHGGKRFEIDHPRATVYRDGVAVETPVSHVNIAPTVLRHLGLPWDGMDGTPLPAAP